MDHIDLRVVCDTKKTHGKTVEGKFIKKIIKSLHAVFPVYVTIGNAAQNEIAISEIS